MTQEATFLHDVWLMLTLICIGGWLALCLTMRGILRPLQVVWPELYRLFWFIFIAVVGTMVELGCADVAAYFFQPEVITSGNLYVRLAGRGAQALTVGIACLASLLINLRRPNGR